MVARRVVEVVGVAIVDGTVGIVVVVAKTVLAAALLEAVGREVSLGDVSTDASPLPTVSATKAIRAAHAPRRSLVTFSRLRRTSYDNPVSTRHFSNGSRNSYKALTSAFALIGLLGGRTRTPR